MSFDNYISEYWKREVEQQGRFERIFYANWGDRITMDSVNHPAHYNAGKFEVIEVIEDWGFSRNYHRGNAIKYAARAGKKNPEKTIEDLEKARWYLQREIELLKAERDGRDTVKPDDMNKTPDTVVKIQSLTDPPPSKL